MSSEIVVNVTEIVEETPSIRSLRLEKPDGTPFAPYQPGAHIDVVGPTGLVRQYSLCGPPNVRSSLLIAVKREPESRGGSEALHGVSVGDQLRIGEPRNLLSVVDDADKHLLVAGGIGITPLLSMAYQLSGQGAEFEFHYFARSRAEAAFLDLLEAQVEFRKRIHLHVDVPRTTLPDVLALMDPELTSDSHVYTCGPQPFMEQVTRTFATTVGEDHIHVEHFVATDIDTSGDEPFTVELDTGEVFEVPADRSILSVLEDHGIEIFKSCEQGICGSCVSGVLEGTPDHRDNCLSESDKAAGTEIALCVSRSLSDKLVIELY